MAEAPDPFLETSGHWSPIIDAHLDRYCRFGEGCPPRLADAMRYSVLAPGKRLRPLLALLAAQACGSPPERAMPAACAVELVHTYSLIHDDLPAMDDDDLRRGRPSCHVAFDEATAILAGDALLTRAFEILATELPGDLGRRCCAELAWAAGPSQLVGGQADDLAAERHAGANAPAAREHLESIHRRKTAAMLRVALRLGGLCGEASPQHLDALDEYGLRLGLAFQIVDDLLDVAGTADQLGKTARKDIARGKLTFPALIGEEASRREAADRIRQAVGALDPLPGDTLPLRGLAHFVLERRR